MNKKNNELKIIRYIKLGFIIFNVLLILISISSAATSQTPYSGTALRVPGTIQVEDFDKGGEGIAYHDTEKANQGNQYRLADGVDIEKTSDTAGGYNIGWTLPGEWLAYTVDVANNGNYNLEARVAYGGTGGTFHIEFNGVDKTGPITVPDTGSYQTWTTLTKTVSLSAGQQVMKIVMDKKGDWNVANINYIRLTQLQSPYSGTPGAIPGTIQAENYDLGGEGIAYHDTEKANQGNQYRLADGVDIEKTSDTAGGYNIGWTLPGEWLAYTVNVANNGNYNLETRVAYGGTGGTFHIEFNGIDKTGPITVPDTGSYQTWTTLTKTVSLSAGQQVMKIVMDKKGDWNVANINYVRITQYITSTPTPIPTPKPTSIPTPTFTPLPTPTFTPIPTPTPPPLISEAFYVATNGNDANPGTESQPWRTIQKAANTLTAGQTVYVKSGTYNEKINIKNSGTVNKYITFSSYPGNTVMIDGTGISLGSWDGLIRVNGASYIKISGFKVIHSSFMGIMVSSNYAGRYPSNIIIQNNYLNDISSSAIFTEDGSYITYDGNEITQSQTMKGLSMQYNEIMNIVRTNNFEIKNNRLYNNVNFESICVKEGSSFGSIHHNDVSGGASHSIFSAGIYVDSQGGSTQNIDIYQNKVHDSTAGGSRGIVVGSEDLGPGRVGSAKNMRIYNNIVWNMGAIGIVAGPTHSSGVVDNITVVNNIAYKNGLTDSWGGGIKIEYVSATNMKIVNNIASQNRNYQIDSTVGTNAVITNNLIDGSGGLTGSSYVTGNPQFVNPITADFSIQSTSPSVDKGTMMYAPSKDFNDVARPKGVGYDIGAFEYSP